MNRGNGGYQRGGFSGGRGGNRTYSSSSGSSNGQHSYNRPVLRPASATRGRVTPPDQINRSAARANSPFTPSKEQSSFIMNGHSISEKYTPSRSRDTSSPGAYTSPSSPTPTRGNYGGNTPGHQYTVQRPVTRHGDSNWAALQQDKVKIVGISKSCWTKQVYQAVSQYGTVVRIDVEQGSRDNNAYVSFQ
jgi:RNA-dependent RNA polymerase